jgi:hypothetical protein
MTPGLWVDPFCGKYSPANLRNDANPEFEADAHTDGLEWLRGLPSNSADGVLFDPPYSCEQALRTYVPKHNGTAGREEYHARCMDELARICKLGAKAIRFGWTSSGLGMTRKFQLERVLLICHGALHYDTIVTVESKIQDGFNFGIVGEEDAFIPARA